MEISISPNVAQAAFEQWQTFIGALALINWAAVMAAMAAPLLVLLARSEVRLRRLRQLQDFDDRYGLSSSANTNQSSLERNPAFEFVLSKYTADLITRDVEPSPTTPMSRHEQKLRVMIEAAHNRKIAFGYRLAMSSLGFILICYFGFDILLRAIGCNPLLSIVCDAPAPLSSVPRIANILLIGALAFLGAYISAVRTLLKRLAVFDLSSNTFLRITLETAASTVLVMIAYTVFADPVSVFSLSTQSLPPTDTAAKIPLVWLALAPILGLIPQSSTKFLLVKLQALIKWAKTTDDRFTEVTSIVSLDVIDGIDYETRFRLEDCGIFDVQNLATYNPILLHIETPFGIYQCIDWIAQAQLCHIVGIERFLILRELNIRTIFDLERAIDSVNSPEEFDDIYASVLLAPTHNLKKTANIGEVKFLILQNPAGVEGPEVKLADVDEYCQWVRKKLSSDPKTLTRSAEHMMCWITDDLHVRRLRRLWNDIAASLEPGSNYFDDSKRAPANRMHPIAALF